MSEVGNNSIFRPFFFCSWHRWRSWGSHWCSRPPFLTTTNLFFPLEEFQQIVMAPFQSLGSAECAMSYCRTRPCPLAPLPPLTYPTCSPVPAAYPRPLPLPPWLLGLPPPHPPTLGGWGMRVILARRRGGFCVVLASKWRGLWVFWCAGLLHPTQLREQRQL